MKKLIQLGLKLFLLFGTLILLSIFNYLMYNLSTNHQIYKTPDCFEKYHHLLILGAGKKNPVFYTRMNAALEVYHRAKINRITCSGLVSVINYNEPYDMRDYLLLNNIPDEVIDLDTAGIRTFQSIENYATRYKHDSVVIISQQQHLQRALFIADCKGLSAVGYAAYDFNGKYNEEWMVKEYLSRLKCTFDLIF